MAQTAQEIKTEINAFSNLLEMSKKVVKDPEATNFLLCGKYGRFWDGGYCNLVRIVMYYVSDCSYAECIRFRSKVKSFFKTWKHYSGNKTYPVATPGLEPGTAYRGSSFNEKWVKGKYAKKRISLVKHCILEIEKHIQVLKKQLDNHIEWMEADVKVYESIIKTSKSITANPERGLKKFTKKHGVWPKGYCDVVARVSGDVLRSADMWDRYQERVDKNYSDEFSRFFETWKHYSGSSTFPVPSASDNTAGQAYLSSTGVAVWEAGPYAKSRISLAKHCVKQAKAHVKELKKEIKALKAK